MNKQPDPQDSGLQSEKRSFEDYDAKIEAVLQALREGEESGEPKPFDPEAFLREMREKFGAV